MALLSFLYTPLLLFCYYAQGKEAFYNYCVFHNGKDIVPNCKKIDNRDVIFWAWENSFHKARKFKMSNKTLAGTFKLKPYRDKSQEKKVSPSWSSPFYSMLIMYTDNIYLTTYSY